MKIVIRLLVCLLGVFVLADCSDSNIPDGFQASLSGRSLRISNSALNFEAQGGVENVSVVSSNIKWRFSELPAWLSVSPLSGSSTTSVAFTAEANLSTDTARTAIFYLESIAEDWNYKVPVSATQTASLVQLKVAANSLTFSGQSGSQVINVVSNTNWDVSSSASWVKAEPSMDKSSVTISVEDNPTDASRTAVITLSAGGRASATINIIQEAAGVTGSTETLNFEKNGGTKSTTITADAAWEAKTSNSWISISPVSGNAGSHTLFITVSENSSVSERTGFVYVVIGTSSKLQIPINQKGLYIETSTNTLSFSADTEQRQLSINSNTDWTVISKPDWLTISPANGNNNHTITITSQKNEKNSSRRGTIKIGKEGVSLFASVDVVQEGLTLSVDNNSMEFSDKASSQTISITTIAEWNAKSNSNWIHLSKTNGIGNHTLTVSVDDNTSENSRKGSVVISAGDLTQTITVIQSGKYFNIDSGEKTFTSTGGNMQISFSTNESWTVSLEQEASWLTLSSTSGNGDGTITVTVKDNASMKARENSVVISPANSPKVRIAIKQSGRYLTVDCKELAFEQKGGTSEPITISSDGSFDISVTDSWMSIKKLSQNKFTVSSLANEGKSRTGIVRIKMVGLVNGESYNFSISVSQEGSDIDGHEYVDLGLPSGTLWAICNLGASSPSDQGEWYAWGETEPLTKANYFGSIWYKSLKYNYTYSFVDVVEKKWGKNWHVPTKEQMEELVKSCTCKVNVDSRTNVILGYYYYSPNGAYLYLPLAKNGNGINSHSVYWTKTITDKDELAYGLFQEGTHQVLDYYRDYGAVIRPVSKK